MSDTIEKQATANYKRWQLSQTYLKEEGIAESIPNCVRFMEGNQWAKVTENTKHIPRPVINVISKIVTNKISNVLSSKVHLNFRADSDEGSTEKFTKFAKYQTQEMELERYDYDAAYDGFVKGTYIYYLFWDQSAVGRRGVAEGGLRCETIDPLNIAVANPLERDCQKQKYIIIRTREEVNAVKEMCDNEKDKNKIVADSLDSNYENEVEQNGKNLVYVYTRFFRIDGEVYFEKSTQYCDIHKPRAMNPNITAKDLKKRNKKDYDKDAEDIPEMYEIDTEKPHTQDSNLEDGSLQDFNDRQTKFSHYPLEIGCLTPRDKCIWGISEVESLMEIQKSINFQLSMILLNAQQLGWGKYLVKDGALRGQKITNQPGQVIVDYTPYGTWGIKPMEGQQFSNGAFDVINNMIELARTVTNSSDIITGDMISKDLSGTAISQIQAQGQKPIEQMQKRFWRSKERIGKILEEFYKLYYENTPYSYEIGEEEYAKREEELRKYANNTNYTGTLPPVSKTSEGTFNGMDFDKTPFNIVVEAGLGTQYSEIMEMDFANNLILNGNIDKISPDNLELLINMYPDSAIPNKTDLKRFIRNKANSEINQLKGQLQQAAQLLQQAQSIMQQKDSQMTAMNEYLKNLKDEFSNKINMQNEQLRSMQDFMKNTPMNTGNNSN